MLGGEDGGCALGEYWLAFGGANSLSALGRDRDNCSGKSGGVLVLSVV